MQQVRKFQKAWAWFLLILCVIYTNGCVVFQWKTYPKETLAKWDGGPVNIYIINQASPHDIAWRIELTGVQKTHIKGNIQKVDPKELGNIRRPVMTRNSRQYAAREYRQRKRLDGFQKSMETNVILTLDPLVAQSLLFNPADSIPLSGIKKMEVYQYNPVTSGVETVLAVTGVTIMAVLILFTIGFANKSQPCPFIYADNTKGAVFKGKIYNGATYPQLERHDWLPLPNLQETGDTYRTPLPTK